MSGGDTKTTTTNQSSETNPYAPTEPLLQNIINSLGGVNTGVTGDQSSALAQIKSELSGMPNLSAPATNAVTGALGFSTAPQSGMLTDAYNTIKSNLAPITDPNNLDPYKTPGFSDALSTLTNDITNSVKGQYAGSGRDPSGAGSFAGSLGRGLMQGEAPVIAAQYNSNVGNLENANNALESGATGTATGLTNAGLSQLQGQFQGLSGAANLPGILTAPGTAGLNLANEGYNLPLSNISGVESLINPIAALGGQSSGSGTSTTTQSQSMLSNILGGAAGLAGLNGALGGGWLSSLGTSLGNGIGSMLIPAFSFSDPELKTDIESIGTTHDGQPLYSYHYVWDDPDSAPHIGLMADEVLEGNHPESVVEIGGYKAVHYPTALQDAARIGMLQMAA